MKKENLAVLIQARAFATSVAKKPLGQLVPKDDGKQEWTRFKSECVLLTRKEK